MNVLQRAAAHLASETDIDESICLGKNGVKLAMEGKYMRVYPRYHQLF